MPSRGELEQRVMELLWAAAEPLTVADVHARLSVERELAYTTVMTVLDRLAKKSQVSRVLDGRAWRYRPRAPQADMVADDIATRLAGLTPETRLATLRLLAGRLTPAEREGLTAALP